MKNKSILNAILTLRAQVRSSSEDQSLFLSSLIGATNKEDRTVTTSDGSAYAFEFINNAWQVTKTNGDNTQQFILNLIDDEIDIEASFDDSFNTVGDFMKDVAESNNLNQVIDNISSLFVTQPNVDVTVLQNVINSCTTDANSISLKQFSALLNLNSNGGKVSQYAFLNIMKNMLSTRKQDGNGLELDDSSAFFVKNAIGTILKSVFTVFAEALAAVLTMINAVIGVLVSVLLKVFSTLANAVNSTANMDVIVKDYDSSTNFFDGVLMASNDRFLGAYVTQSDLVRSGLNAVTVEIGPSVFYLWRTSDEHSGVDYMSVNGFLTMGLHPERTIAALCADSRLTITVVDGYNPAGKVHYNITSAGGGYFDILGAIPDSCYLTIEEQTALKYASRSVRNAYAMFNRTILEFCRLQLQYGNTYDLQLQPWWSPSAVTDWLVPSVYIINNAIGCYISNGNLNAWMSTFGTASASTMLTSMMILSINDYAVSWTGAGNSTNGYRWNQRMQFLTPSQTLNQMYYCASILGLVTSWNSETSFSWKNTTPFMSDVIPSGRTWSFASASWQDIAAAIAITATVAAASIICFAVGRAQLKKFTFKKQLQNYSKLQQARSNYIDSDTGMIKADPDGTYFKAYYKATKRYNLYGKLFGWGSYDPVNNWVNVDSTVSSDSGLNKFNTGLASQKEVTDMQTSMYIQLSQIRGLITG